MLRDVTQETDQVQNRATEISSKSLSLLINGSALKNSDSCKVISSDNGAHFGSSDKRDSSDSDNFNQLNNTEKIIADITEKLHQKIKEQAEFMKTKEKYERDIKKLNQENARLLEKTIQTQLKMHESKIQALSSGLPIKDEYLQPGLEDADVLHTPEKKKKNDLIEKIKKMEKEKNERENDINLMKQRLEEEKKELSDRVLQIKNEASLTNQLKDDIKKLSKSNRNLKSKMRKFKKENLVSTKNRVKEVKDTMNITVKQLETDLMGEKKTVVNQKAEISELQAIIRKLTEERETIPRRRSCLRSPVNLNQRSRSVPRRRSVDSRGRNNLDSKGRDRKLRRRLRSNSDCGSGLKNSFIKKRSLTSMMHIHDMVKAEDSDMVKAEGSDMVKAEGKDPPLLKPQKPSPQKSPTQRLIGVDDDDDDDIFTSMGLSPK